MCLPMTWRIFQKKKLDFFFLIGDFFFSRDRDMHSANVPSEDLENEEEKNSIGTVKTNN